MSRPFNSWLSVVPLGLLTSAGTAAEVTNSIDSIHTHRDPTKLDQIRMLFVGEDGVGKTSLILSMLTGEFQSEVPPKADDMIINAYDESDEPDLKVSTCIIDFSAQEQNENDLIAQIKEAHVICVVYSVDLKSSIEKIESFWMKKIHEVLGGPEHGTPVILVGNKADQPDVSNFELIVPIMTQYGEIETCVECSARNMKNVNELFLYAHKAVLHPTHPLYIPEEKELTAACKKALVRIFKICDQDNDGLLNDFELNKFQMRCFNIPLNNQALMDVKTVVKRGISDGILDNAITLGGFLYLHVVFIQRGRHETVWKVLRKFGYDNSLQLKNEYLCPKLNVNQGCTTELSVDGYHFLAALFEKYDEDKDGCLSRSELENLFSVCPRMPWGDEVYSQVPVHPNTNYLTFDGFHCKWQLTTLLDFKRTCEWLAYLGYVIDDRDQTKAIKVTRDKRIDLKTKETSRSVFQCRVIGPKGVGKTAILQGLLIQNCLTAHEQQQQASTSFSGLRNSSLAMAKVRVIGQDKFLMMQEIDLLKTRETTFLSHYELSCDVVALVYDVSNAESFQYCARLYKKYFEHSPLPCLFIGTKADLGEVEQEYEMQPLEFCHRYRLPPPILWSSSEPQHQLVNNNIYNRLAFLAEYPHRKHVSPRLWDLSATAYVSVGVFLAVAGLVAISYARGTN